MERSASHAMAGLSVSRAAHRCGPQTLTSSGGTSVLRAISALPVASTPSHVQPARLINWLLNLPSKTVYYVLSIRTRQPPAALDAKYVQPRLLQAEAPVHANALDSREFTNPVMVNVFVSQDSSLWTTNLIAFPTRTEQETASRLCTADASPDKCVVQTASAFQTVQMNAVPMVAS